jgi:hypothetical protein
MNRFQNLLSTSTCAATHRAVEERGAVRAAGVGAGAVQRGHGGPVQVDSLTVSKPVFKAPLVSALETKK